MCTQEIPGGGEGPWFIGSHLYTSLLLSYSCKLQMPRNPKPENVRNRRIALGAGQPQRVTLTAVQ